MWTFNLILHTVEAFAQKNWVDYVFRVNAYKIIKT